MPDPGGGGRQGATGDAVGAAGERPRPAASHFEIGPALEALSRSLPDWLDHAPHIWGHGVGPRDLALLRSSTATRRRRAQIEADLQALQANFKIA